MNSMRTDIANFRNPGLPELILEVQVIGIHQRRKELLRKQRLVNLRAGTRTEVHPTAGKAGSRSGERLRQSRSGLRRGVACIRRHQLNRFDHAVAGNAVVEESIAEAEYEAVRVERT